MSSPGKEPPPGPDGIVCEHAGGGAGFEVSMLNNTYSSINHDFQVEDVNTVNTSTAQQLSDERFLLNAKARLHGTVRWVA